MAMSRWVASDIDTAVLHAHCGPSLESMGVQIMQLNALQLPDELSKTSSLVVSSCINPPYTFQDHIRSLLRKYTGWSPGRDQMRVYYEAFVLEAVVAQLPGSTIVSCCRKSDQIYLGKISLIGCTMEPVPGYKPKACNHHVSAALQDIQGCDSLVMRFNLDGCLEQSTLMSYLQTHSSIDLVDICQGAVEQGVNVIFLGEWDGALCYACKKACDSNPTRVSPFKFVMKTTMCLSFPCTEVAWRFYRLFSRVSCSC